MSTVRYYALFYTKQPVSGDEGDAPTCAMLDTDASSVLAEAGAYLEEGYCVQIDIGEMEKAEYDAIKEVPDDFVARIPAPATTGGAS